MARAECAGDRPLNTSPSDRVLPHNLQAERSFLGAMLIHQEAFRRLNGAVEPRHFFRVPHQHIFGTIRILAARGSAIDLVTVKEELARSGHLEAVGGPAYISGLVDGEGRSTNVEDYGRIIVEKALLRDMI